VRSDWKICPERPGLTQCSHSKTSAFRLYRFLDGAVRATLLAVGRQYAPVDPFGDGVDYGSMLVKPAVPETFTVE
jgi:hypothetical protein